MAGLGPASLRDDFSQNLGWELGEKGSGGVSLVGERLAIAVRQAFAFILAPSPARESSDFLLEVTMRPDLCRGDDEFGVAFRVTSLGEYYLFTLTCDGGARVRRVLQDASRALVPFTSSLAIFPGPLAENRLAVLAEGADFRYFVNGVEIFSARDLALASGGVGLYVRTGRGGQTTVLFDNLILRPILPTPTPTSTETITSQ